MIRFTPVWRTPGGQPLDTSPLLEGDAFSFQLLADNIASIAMPVADTVTIPLGISSASVSKVVVNGGTLDDARVQKMGASLILDLSGLSVSVTAFVDVWRSTSLDFTILYGELPPGLSLGSSGIISGIIDNVPYTQQTSYEFTVRTTNGTYVRDQSFTIRVIPVERESTWVTNGLPLITEDEDLNIDFYAFGSARRAEAFSYTLDVADEDDEIPQVVVKSNTLVGSFQKTLPDGLQIIDNIIQGAVSPNATPGRYLFKLGFPNQTSNTIYGEIIVLDVLVAAVPTGVVGWATEAGSLGDIPETYPCDLGVKATGAENVAYSLAPGSLPLPSGIRLNAATGDLEGFMPAVITDTTYRFTVRATAGGNHVDREFSLRITNKFTSPVLDIRLRMATVEARNMVVRYRTLVSNSKQFRPGDSNFGVPREPFIYLLKGVSGNLDEATATPSDSIGGSNYHGKISLLLGQHKWAAVRDAADNVVYEVIYRDIIDPLANAGGFVVNSDIPIEEKVVYPQSNPNNIKYIYPRSIRNARYDLVKDLGFAVADVTKQRKVGPDGGEALPRWMTSPQSPNTPTSVLGFIPALVVAYVKTGMANALVTTLNADSNLPVVGRVLIFDKYHVFEAQQSAATIFDEDTTTFDGDGATPTSMTFDG